MKTLEVNRIINRTNCILCAICGLANPRKLAMGCSVVALSAVLCTAPAQAESVWQSVTISSLPSGSILGGVWARTRNEAYVWASQHLGSGIYNAGLYRWNGSQWYKVLDAPGSFGYSVHGVGNSEVFAGSESTIWRSTDNGQSWILQSLPSFTGSLRKLSGTVNNIQIATDSGQILRFDGSSWSIIFNDSYNSVYALHVPSANEGYYVTCWGWGRWNGSGWHFNGSQFDFCDVGDTWWTRDSSDNLHWYAVGNNNFANGVRVWKFDPASNSFGSKYDYVFADGTNYNIGGAYQVWGSAADDVYVVGALADTSGGTRNGRLYHYDGTNWSRVTEAGAFLEPWGIAGTGRDDVWISLRYESRLLHYAPLPPTLNIAMYAGITVSGQVGSTYQIEYTTDISNPTNWVALTNLTLASSPYLFFDASSAGEPTRFYRALLVP